MTAIESRIAQLCAQAIDNRVFPGCQVAYVRGGQLATAAFGRLTYEAESPAVQNATLYDVASITKSVPTSSLVAKLIEEGRLGLDDRVIEMLPELNNQYRESILVRHLLTYTVVLDLPAGLTAAVRNEQRDVLEIVMNTPLSAPPGEKYVYTNGPAILLGLIVERLCGMPLDAAAQNHLFQPLGLTAITFRTDQVKPELIAPTEATANGELRGTVHDESARAMTADGQRSGAAGVFSNATDLARYSQMLLGEGALDGVRIFMPETVRNFHTNQIANLGASTGLGWELNSRRVMGAAASNDTFGKTGFTGCVMMIDPQKQAAVVHLSNRTYPRRPESRDAINAFRRELADIVFGAA